MANLIAHNPIVENKIMQNRTLYRVVCSCGYTTVWAAQLKTAMQMYRKHLPKRDTTMLGAKEGLQ
jgi:hypothetical protein